MVESPCNKICTLNAGHTCVGCGRSRAPEIGGWSQMSDADRRRVVAMAKERRNRGDGREPESGKARPGSPLEFPRSPLLKLEIALGGGAAAPGAGDRRIFDLLADARDLLRELPGAAGGGTRAYRTSAPKSRTRPRRSDRNRRRGRVASFLARKVDAREKQGAFRTLLLFNQLVAQSLSLSAFRNRRPPSSRAERIDPEPRHGSESRGFRDDWPGYFFFSPRM